MEVDMTCHNSCGTVLFRKKKYCDRCENMLRMANRWRNLNTGTVHSGRVHHNGYTNKDRNSWYLLDGLTKCGIEFTIGTMQPTCEKVTCKRCLHELGKIGRITVTYDPEKEMVLVVPKDDVYLDIPSTLGVKVIFAPGRHKDYIKG